MRKSFNTSKENTNHQYRMINHSCKNYSPPILLISIEDEAKKDESANQHLSIICLLLYHQQTKPIMR